MKPNSSDVAELVERAIANGMSLSILEGRLVIRCETDQIALGEQLVDHEEAVLEILQTRKSRLSDSEIVRLRFQRWRFTPLPSADRAS